MHWIKKLRQNDEDVMKHFLFMVVVLAGTCTAVTVFQNWENMAGWTLRMDEGMDPDAFIGRAAHPQHGRYYLDANVFRSNGPIVSIYFPLGEAAIAAGTQAGNFPELWIQYDLKGISGTSTTAYASALGIFNANCDNADNSHLNFVGINHGHSTRSTARKVLNGVDAFSGTLFPLSGVEAYRVKAHIYNSGGRTLMDVAVYGCNAQGALMYDAGSVVGWEILGEGETLDKGMDVFGIKNWKGSPNSTRAYYDNLYFSTEGEYVGDAWPSWIEQPPACFYAIRPDHPRLFFNSRTQSQAVSRALNEQNKWYRLIKAKVDLLPAEEEWPSNPADYGLEAAWSAFVYLADGDTRYRDTAKRCIESSLDYYEQCYAEDIAVNWYSHTRTHVAMAWDWLYHDLTATEREQYMSRLVNVVYNVKNDPPSGEHISSYQEGMYGIIGLLWPIGATAYGTGIETDKVNEFLVSGMEENFRMLEYRKECAGDDGGGASPTEGYLLNWYPYAEWNFFYMWKSSTGQDISRRWDHNALLPNYILWHYLPDHKYPRGFGYGDDTHWANRLPARYLYYHLSVIEHLYANQYPFEVKLAQYIKQQLPVSEKRYRFEEYFIYPFIW